MREREMEIEQGKEYTIIQLAEIWGIKRTGALKRAAKENFEIKEITENGRTKKIYSLPKPMEAPEQENKAIAVKTKSAYLESLKKEPQCIDELDSESRKVANSKLFLCIRMAEELKGAWKDKTEVINKFAAEAPDRFPEIVGNLKGLKGDGLSPRTLRSWYKIYQEHPDSPEKLAPKYGIARRGERDLSEKERQEIMKLASNKNKLSIRAIADYLVMTGISDRNKYGIIRNFMLNDIPKAVLDYGRMGEKEFADKRAPHVTRDWSTVAPNEIWVSDGHDLEMMCYHPTKRNNKGEKVVITPKLVAWEDEGSRVITGWAIVLEENTEAVLSALKEGIKRWGKPKILRMDNGKAYRNKQLEGNEEIDGIFATLGMEVTHALPYNAKSKMIERLWQNFKEFSKLFPTFKGGNTAERPENLKKVLKKGEEIPEFSEVVEIFKMLIEYNNSLYYEMRGGHRGDGMKKMTPLEKMNTLPPAAREFVPEEKLRLLCMYREERTITQQGVTIWGQVYNCEEVPFNVGERVIVKYDAKDLSKVYIYSKDGRYMFEAKCISKVRYDDINGLKENRKAEKQYRKALRMMYESAYAVSQTSPAIQGNISDDMERLDHKMKIEKKNTQKQDIEDDGEWRPWENVSLKKRRKDGSN